MQDSASDRTLIDVRFDHIIIPAQDAPESAEFLSEIFGLPSPVQAGFFQQVRLSDGRIIDFAEPRSDFPGQHYAFLVNEHTFDRIVGLLRDWQWDHWADPQQSQPGEINTNHGGRGVYLLDPSGHYLEALIARYDGTDQLSGPGHRPPRSTP